MFACTDYPSEDPGLYAEVAEEAAFKSGRLRNHPSLALWCGNNEIEGMHGLVTRSVAPGKLGLALLPPAVPETRRAGLPFGPVLAGQSVAPIFRCRSTA